MITKGYFLLFLIETVCCDPSSEPSRRDGSDEESQHMLLWRIDKTYPFLSSTTPSYLELWHGSELAVMVYGCNSTFFSILSIFNFLFVSLGDLVLLNGDQLLKERICTFRSKLSNCWPLLRTEVEMKQSCLPWKCTHSYLAYANCADQV